MKKSLNKMILIVLSFKEIRELKPCNELKKWIFFNITLIQ